MIDVFWNGTDAEVLGILEDSPQLAKAVQEPTGWTLLHLAALVDHSGILPTIVQLGADVNARDSLSFTPLHAAVREGNSLLVEFLLQHGANPNLQSSEGRTPLENASRCLHESCYNMIMLLCRHGASLPEILQADDKGVTLLHRAARAGRADVVSLLLQRFPPDLRTKQGQSPLHFVSGQNTVHVAGELLRAGADPMMKDNSGESPLMRAVRIYPNSDLSRLLQERSNNAD